MALSDEKIKETLEAAKKAKRKDGTYNFEELSRLLGIDPRSASRRMATIATQGMLGFEPVLPGFAIKKVSSQLDTDGLVQKTFVQQQREPGEVFELPKGQLIKGVSALVGSDGRITQQWIKTSKDSVDPLELAALLRESFDNWIPAYVPPKASAWGSEDKLTLYPISDLHVGMMAYGKETGEDWDLKIAEDVILDTYASLISMTPSTNECVVLFGGDQQHADNFDGMTERSGHVLDVDGRYPKVYFTLCRIAVEIAMMARANHHKVTIRVLQGNHDRHSAIALAYFLHAWFKDDSQVTVDVDPSLFWFMAFGNTLLCAVHGHTIKARDLAGKVAATQAKKWGNTVFRYCHYFHEHHDEIVSKDEAGLKVEKHAIIAPADAYAAAGAWSSVRNAKSIVYSQETGEVGRSVVNIVPLGRKAA